MKMKEERGMYGVICPMMTSVEIEFELGACALFMPFLNQILKSTWFKSRGGNGYLTLYPVVTKVFDSRLNIKKFRACYELK